MLKLGIYCIFDSVAGAHLPPFTLPSDEMAQRTFGDCVQDQGSSIRERHAFSVHPDHYTLMKIGEFQTISGTVVAQEPVSLGNGLAFVLPAKE